MKRQSFIAFTRAAAAIVLSVPLFAASPSLAADKIVFMTSWFAQAEHGGFYEAKALGLYEKEGLDVTLKMGGPQVNGMQLLLAGESDVYLGQDFQMLNGAITQGFPLVVIAATFQHDLQGLMTHPDVASLSDLKGHKILMATASRQSWWPWLKARYSLSDDQAGAYTFNLQPFLADATIVQQAYPTSEPFPLIQQGIPYHFFLFGDEGYPPYGSPLVTRRDVISTKPDALRRFVHASMLGWKNYLADPAPANALIKIDNPQMTDAQIAFGIAHLKELKFVDGGDAATMGIGTITEARYQKTIDYMISADLLKPGADWHAAIDTDFIKTAKVMP